MQIRAAMFLFPVYDECREASQTIAHGLEKTFHGGGIDDLKHYTAAVALNGLAHPIGKVGVFFLKVLRNGGFELFSMYPFTGTGLLPDHFAVLAVKELRGRVCKDFDENWFFLWGSRTDLCHSTSQVLPAKPFLAKAASHCNVAKALG
jgi:hypothetical protein